MTSSTPSPASSVESNSGSGSAASSRDVSEFANAAAPGRGKGHRRLRAKDWISLGVYAVVYVVIMYAVSMIGFIPVLMPLTGVFIGILCQVPIMLLGLKIRRFGVFTILGVLLALVAGLGAWPTLVSCVVCGVAADAIRLVGREGSRPVLVLAAAVFNMWSYGKYYPFFFQRDAYLRQIAAGYGQDYVNGISGLFPMWLAWGMPIALFVSGLVGAWMASRLLSKHFDRAGLV